MKKLLLSFFLFTGCYNQTTCPTPKENKPSILVTIAPYQFLVEQIGGNAIQVETIIPWGANPHSYEPTMRQVSELKKGTIWFQIGEAFEKIIEPMMKQQNPALITVDLCDGIQLLPIDDEGCHCCRQGLDRHIWLSPNYLVEQAQIVEQTLSRAFPKQRELFAIRLSQFEKSCLDLQEELDILLSPLAGGSLVVSHPAFGYFCHDFHLYQLSVEQEGKEPRPRHLEKLIAQASTNRPFLALALPQYNNRGVELIADKLHLPLQTIDPYAPDCLATIRTLTQLLLHSKEAAGP